MVRWPAGSIVIALLCCATWLDASPASAEQPPPPQMLNCDQLVRTLYGIPDENGGGGVIGDLRGFERRSSQLAQQEAKVEAELAALEKERHERHEALDFGTKIEARIKAKSKELGTVAVRLVDAENDARQRRSAVAAYRDEMKRRNCPDPYARSAPPAPALGPRPANMQPSIPPVQATPPPAPPTPAPATPAPGKQGRRVTPTTGNWTGTYAAGPNVIRIGGSGRSVTGVDHWTSPGESYARHGGDQHYGPCTVLGNTARCPNAHGEYHDPDKTIVHTSVCTLTLNGDSLTASCTLNSARATWRVAPYTSAVHTGATFTETVRRVGPNPGGPV